MSAIHVETAIAQLGGTRHLLDGDARALAGADALVDQVVAHVDDFAEWLQERLPDATGARGSANGCTRARCGTRIDDDVTPDSLDDGRAAATSS